ncbi:heterokaryon incompatibility, partial [Xylaria flabelliformis]
MRLLKLRSNGIIELTGEYTNVNIPRYAILSHTWGRENQEVTFQDITSGGGLHKDCYQKLEFCAQQAAADGIRYFWVDTCCIDKTNSVVYNEAINSMYRWYKSADKCYVYMVDVRGNSRRWKSAFRDSRWFTRGWTLQELIAPKSVTFYGCDGVRLGSKTGSLEGLIHDITGIHKDALQGAPMDNFTVQERFSWFGDRQTKKEEDMIYSQLGIFGVYMEMIYGEGYDGAKQRLQERIER